MLDLQEWEEDYKVAKHESEITKNEKRYSNQCKKTMKKSASILKEECFASVRRIKFLQGRDEWFKKISESSSDPRISQKLNQVEEDLQIEIKRYLDVKDLMQKYDLHFID